MSNAILAATLAQSLRAMGKGCLEAASILSDAASATPEADTQAVKADTLPASNTYDPADPAKATNPADLVNPGLPGIRIDNAIDWSTAKPAEPAKPTEPAKPKEPAGPTGPTKDEVVARIKAAWTPETKHAILGIMARHGIKDVASITPDHYRVLLDEIAQVAPHPTTPNDPKEDT